MPALRLPAAHALLLTALVACHAPDGAPGDDGLDLGGDTIVARRADGPSVAGVWWSPSSPIDDGDLRFVSFTGDSVGSFVRLRCYHHACSAAFPEEDRFQVVRSTTGRTYVLFLSFTRRQDPLGHWWDEPVVADAYEVKRTPIVLELRKTTSSHWRTFHLTDAQERCIQSEGVWEGAACTCPARPGVRHVAFAPGAGGCIAAAWGTEANCDETQGDYTDDDPTAIGTYCRCGLGRHMTELGCAAN